MGFELLMWMCLCVCGLTSGVIRCQLRCHQYPQFFLNQSINQLDVGLARLPKKAVPALAGG